MFGDEFVHGERHPFECLVEFGQIGLDGVGGVGDVLHALPPLSTQFVGMLAVGIGESLLLLAVAVSQQESLLVAIDGPSSFSQFGSASVLGIYGHFVGVGTLGEEQLQGERLGLVGLDIDDHDELVVEQHEPFFHLFPLAGDIEGVHLHRRGFGTFHRFVVYIEGVVGEHPLFGHVPSGIPVAGLVLVGASVPEARLLVGKRVFAVLRLVHFDVEFLNRLGMNHCA